MDPVTAQAIGQEIDSVIDQSFADGYKAASLRYSPQAEFWKAKYEAHTCPPAPPSDFWPGFSWGAGGGVMVGIGLTVSVLSLVQKVWQ